MVSQRMLQLGTARSVIRELFEYGRQRAAEVGAENVFDFSLGNPSVPAPAEVNETAIRLLREQADTIHCYTSAPGDPAARQRIADSLNRRFGEQYTADELYLTVGAAASLCCVLGGLTCPGDEYILFATPQDQPCSWGSGGIGEGGCGCGAGQYFAVNYGFGGSGCDV